MVTISSMVTKTNKNSTTTRSVNSVTRLIKDLHQWYWVTFLSLRYVFTATNRGISRRSATSSKLIWQEVTKDLTEGTAGMVDVAGVVAEFPAICCKT